MYKLESILGNERHEILWDSEIQTDHLIPTRRPGLVLINLKKRICLPTVDRVKMKESKKTDK